MTCHDFVRSIQDLLDRRRFEPDDPAFEPHARSCPDCRAVLGQYQRLVQSLALLPPPPLPDGLADRVLSAARPPRRSKWPAYPPAWALLPLAAAAAIGLVFIPNRRPEPSARDGIARVQQHGMDEAPASGPAASDEAVRQEAAAESFRQAGEAFWDLARHTASDVQRTGSLLLASTAPRRAGPAEAPARLSHLPPSGAERLKQGIKPLANAAGDAFGYLWRDEEVLAER